MRKLLNECYCGYGFSNIVGNAYFEDFFPGLLKYEFMAVLKHLMRSYPQRFVLDFILSSSSWWVNLAPDIWIDLLKSNDLRIDVSHESDQNARFSDIEFLVGMSR